MNAAGFMRTRDGKDVDVKLASDTQIRGVALANDCETSAVRT